MKYINAYDIEADKIDRICEEKDITEAELIEALIAALENKEFDLNDYI